MKLKVQELRLELEEMGNSEDAIGDLEHALIEAWEALDDSIIKSCFKSIKKRQDTIIAANGWHTKY